MKGKILNNIGFKILSAVCAILLWGIIINVYDPSQSVTISGVTVQLQNESSLSDKGYTYEVVDGGKISVYISGPGSIVRDIKATDIVATADLSKVTAYSDYADIEVRVQKEGVSASSIEVTPKTTAVKLNIENRVSQTFDIEVETTGTPAAGYVISNTQISPTTVKLTGSASSIENVAKVKAVYDVSGATMDIVDTAQLKLYDSDGEEINDSKIEMSKSSVDFRATLQESKTVPIRFDTTGDVASGYSLQGIEYSSTEAVITGSDEALKKIDAIDIPASVIDITGITSDTVYNIKISNYIPSGVQLVTSDTITATAKVSSVTEKVVTIPVSSITLKNQPDGYDVSFGSQKTINITVMGLESALSNANADTVKAVLDLSGIAEGTSNGNLTFSLPSGCNLKKKYDLQVTLTKNNQSSTTPSEGETANSTSTEPSSSASN